MNPAPFDFSYNRISAIWQNQGCCFQNSGFTNSGAGQRCFGDRVMALARGTAQEDREAHMCDNSQLNNYLRDRVMALARGTAQGDRTAHVCDNSQQ
jgi:hypothetical protein